MSASGGISFKNPLPGNIAEFGAKLMGAVIATMAYNAPRAEEYMKSNAPWTDQTGNARGGLAARPYGSIAEQSAGIVLFHQVPYGIWLEVKQSGEYAIIEPTVQVFGPEVMGQLDDLIGALK